MSGYLVEENLGATVKVHVHGVVIRDVGVDRGTEIGQHILEGKILTGELKHNNIDFGRPWSGWVGLNVIAERLSGPYISYTNSQLTGGGRNWRHRINFVSGRGEPGASVHVHMPGVLAQWVGVDGAGNWSIQIGREFPRGQVPNIEVFQAKGGYPNSVTVIFDYNRAQTYTLLQII